MPKPSQTQQKQQPKGLPGVSEKDITPSDISLFRAFVPTEHQNLGQLDKIQQRIQGADDDDDDDDDNEVSFAGSGDDDDDDDEGSSNIDVNEIATTGDEGGDDDDDDDDDDDGEDDDDGDDDDDEASEETTNTSNSEARGLEFDDQDQPQGLPGSMRQQRQLRQQRQPQLQQGHQHQQHQQQHAGFVPPHHGGIVSGSGGGSSMTGTATSSQGGGSFAYQQSGFPRKSFRSAAYKNALDEVLMHAKARAKGRGTSADVRLTSDQSITLSRDDHERMELLLMLESMKKVTGMKMHFSEKMSTATLANLMKRYTEICSQNNDLDQVLNLITNVADALQMFITEWNLLPLNDYNIRVRKECARSNFRFAIHRLLQRHRGVSSFSPVREIVISLMSPILYAVIKKLTLWVARQNDSLQGMANRLSGLFQALAGTVLGSNPDPFIPADTPGVFSEDGGDRPRPNIPEGFSGAHHVSGNARRNLKLTGPEVVSDTSEDETLTQHDSDVDDDDGDDIGNDDDGQLNNAAEEGSPSYTATVTPASSRAYSPAAFSPQQSQPQQPQLQQQQQRQQQLQKPVDDGGDEDGISLTRPVTQYRPLTEY